MKTKEDYYKIQILKIINSKKINYLHYKINLLIVIILIIKKIKKI
jgi:hypothetical protein